MKEDIEETVNTVCSTCLSSGRDLNPLTGLAQVYQIFNLLMNDFTGDRFNKMDSELYVCWECLSLMKKFGRFKRQVHDAQEQLYILDMSIGQEGIDQTYKFQSLSSLKISMSHEYDKIFLYDSAGPGVEEPQCSVSESAGKAIRYNVAQTMKHHILLEPLNVNSKKVDQTMKETLKSIKAEVEDPELSLSKETVPHVGTSANILCLSESSDHDIIPIESIKQEPNCSTVEISIEFDHGSCDTSSKVEVPGQQFGFIREYMSEADMLASREDLKQDAVYANTVYKCELCIIGFYDPQDIENHYTTMHISKPGLLICKVCYVYMEERVLPNHLDQHYLRYQCKECSYISYNIKLMNGHIKEHKEKAITNMKIKMMEDGPMPCEVEMRTRKYQCRDCDLSYDTPYALKTHVQHNHRDRYQCDYCKRLFFHRNTLISHLQHHEGPVPREACPICQKQVRVIQLKNHIQQHQNKGRYECEECQKVFSHLNTYRAHLRNSKVHAGANAVRYHCSVCKRGYTSVKQMQDHFNYHHLGKTSHKCPVCDKLIANLSNVKRHMMRVHGDKKQKDHVCQECGKAFADKQALAQHKVIHTDQRIRYCDICNKGFKHSSSLYSHKRRVHKIFKEKKVLEFIDNKPPEIIP